MFQFQALGSRRFQLGFHRFNLHRPTRVVETGTEVAADAVTLSMDSRCAARSAAAPVAQGLTLVHVLAHRRRILWDRGCI